jgi:hypothetical protein
MASKPAPTTTARTRSTETKQEKEAAARAAELASVAAQAAKQAAEEAASLAATQAVAAALAGVEARFAGLEGGAPPACRLHRGRRRFGQLRRALHFCKRVGDWPICRNHVQLG